MIETALSRQALLAWLTSPHVIRPDGAVMSWHNPAHPGYAYPEIAGLMLSLLGRFAPETRPLRKRIVTHLVAGVTPNGGIARGQNAYAFDTAMVLSGVLADQADVTASTRAMAGRLYSFITAQLARRIGLDGPVQRPSHWSSSFGCHLLKTALAVTAYVERESVDMSRAAWRLLEQLVANLAPLQVEGRFRIHTNSQGTYLHSHCYATEGLLCLRARGFAGLDVAIEESAAWLASIQRPEGGVPAWHDGQDATGEMHADASAQAIRIWQLVDRDHFATAIARGLDFLSGLTAPSGGVRYSPGSEDVNTWASIFAWQAWHWVDHPADALEII